MGCSLVTVFEVLHHIVLIFLKTSVKSVSRIHRTIRCVPENQASSGVTLAALMQTTNLANLTTLNTNFENQELNNSETSPLTPNRAAIMLKNNQCGSSNGVITNPIEESAILSSNQPC